MSTPTVPQKKEQNWLETPAVEGFPAFVRIPPAFLLDPKVGPRERLVYMCLAAHADLAGRCEPSLDRIAEMCGFYSQGKPDRALLSKLTKNLELRGWLVKKGQKGFNRVQTYQLQVSKTALDDLRTVKDRQVPDADYKEQKQQDVVPDFKAMGFENVDDYLDYQNREGRFTPAENPTPELPFEEAPKPAPATAKPPKNTMMKDLKDWKGEAQAEDYSDLTREKLSQEVADFHDGLLELSDLPPAFVFMKHGLRRPSYRSGF